MKTLAVVAVLLSSIAHAEPIPTSWYGHWKGTVQGRFTGGAWETKAMETTIAPIRGTQDLEWTIRYEGERARGYTLRAVDVQNGHYLLDENNGILIDEYFADGILFSQFEVSGRRLTCQTQLRDGVLHGEISSFNVAAPRRSGPPSVTSFGFATYQESNLSK